MDVRDPRPPGARPAMGRLLMPALAIALAVGAVSSATAQGRHPPRAEPPRWHGDISRFHEHDWELWRRGRWVHGRHEGRMGWWWVVVAGLGAYWFFYPAPVYPYPNPWEPPPVPLATPPATGTPPPPPTPYWYFCDRAQAYYPYVATCPDGWRAVPAAPPPPAQRE